MPQKHRRNTTSLGRWRGCQGVKGKDLGPYRAGTRLLGPVCRAHSPWEHLGHTEEDLGVGPGLRDSTQRVRDEEGEIREDILWSLQSGRVQNQARNVDTRPFTLGPPVS